MGKKGGGKGLLGMTYEYIGLGSGYQYTSALTLDPAKYNYYIQTMAGFSNFLRTQPYFYSHKIINNVFSLISGNMSQADVYYPTYNATTHVLNTAYKVPTSPYDSYIGTTIIGVPR